MQLIHQNIKIGKCPICWKSQSMNLECLEYRKGNIVALNSTCVECHEHLELFNPWFKFTENIPSQNLEQISKEYSELPIKICLACGDFFNKDTEKGKSCIGCSDLLYSYFRFTCSAYSLNVSRFFSCDECNELAHDYCLEKCSICEKSYCKACVEEKQLCCGLIIANENSEMEDSYFEWDGIHERSEYCDDSDDYYNMAL